MFKKLIIALFFLLILDEGFSQYTGSPNNKITLGKQTTGDGLVFRTSGKPTYSPSNATNAWISIDTLTGNLWTYYNGEWRLEMPGDLNVNYPLVINKTADIIYKGMLVMIDTSQIIQGDNLRVMRAVGDGSVPSKYIIGVATQQINTDETGYITWFGYVREVIESEIAQTGVTIDTGQILYPSATQPGRYTNIPPSPPNLKSTIAIVVRKPTANNLTILVRPSLNEDLEELNDLDLSGISNGQTIVWDSTNGKWVAGDVGERLGTVGANQIAYGAASGDTLTSNSNLYWDNSHLRLGIGTSSPAYTLDVVGVSRLGSFIHNSIFSTEFYISDTSFTIGSYSTKIGAGRTTNAIRTTALGYNAGSGKNAIEDGIYIGYNTIPLNDSESNAIVIGSQAISKGNNTTVIGNSVTNATYLPGGSLMINSSSTPERTLHVNGEARITDLTTDTPTRIVGADADGDLGQITIGSGLSLSGSELNATGSGTVAANKVAFGAASGDTLTSDSLFHFDAVNRRLGIGTTTPESALTVNAATANDNLRVYVPTSITSGGFNALNLIRDGNGAGPRNINIGFSHYSNFDFSRGTFVFTRGRGSSTSPAGVLNNDWIGSLTFVSIDSDGVAVPSTAQINAIADADATSGTTPTRLSFVAGTTDANRPERMVIKSDGNVGIATTAPSSILSIGGNSARTIGTERHTTANTAGNNLTIKVGGAASGATDAAGGDLVLESGISTGTGSSNIIFATAAAGGSDTTDRTPAERMRIDGSGNVGIGTDEPKAKLHVNGPLSRNAVTKTSSTNHTVSDTETWIYFDNTGASTMTVALPSATIWVGRELHFRTNADGVINSESSNVDGADGNVGTAIIVTGATMGFATLVSDGTNWVLMATDRR